MEFLRCHLIPVKTQFLSFDCFYLSLVYLNFSFFFLGRKVVFLNVSSFCEKLCTYHWSEWTIKMGFNRSDCKVYWYGHTREYPDIISSAVWHWQIDATTSCNWNSKFLCALKLIFSRTTQFILILSCLLASNTYFRVLSWDISHFQAKSLITKPTYTIKNYHDNKLPHKLYKRK